MERALLLRPSQIEDAGVGCFATESIPANEPVLRSSERLRKLAQAAIHPAYLKFCVHLESDLFLAPEDFLRMNMLWYANHAKHPNLTFHGNKLWTNQPIAAGEELTLYYPDLLTHPTNKTWVRPEHI